MTRKKKKVTRRNPVVREFIANPKRNAGSHQTKKPSKREERKLNDLEAYVQWSLAFKARIKKENSHGEN